MRFRNEIIQIQRGRQALAIRRDNARGAVQFIGTIDGRHCVSSPTREGAMSALLRRLAYGASL